MQWSSFCAHSCWLRNSQTPLWPSIVPCIPIPASTILVAGSLEKNWFETFNLICIRVSENYVFSSGERGTDLMLPISFILACFNISHSFIHYGRFEDLLQQIYTEKLSCAYVHFSPPFSTPFFLPSHFLHTPSPFLPSPSLFSTFSLPLPLSPLHPPFSLPSFSSLLLPFSLPPHLFPLPPLSASPFSSFSPGLPPPFTPSFIVLICGTHINVITLTIH